MDWGVSRMHYPAYPPEIRNRNGRNFMKSVLVLWLSAWFSNVTTTQFVDDVERQLAANRDTYMAGTRTPALQKAALQYFDDRWVWLQSSDACGSKLLGRAGQACIADRMPSGRYPWERFYRDPIVQGHY